MTVETTWGEASGVAADALVLPVWEGEGLTGQAAAVDRSLGGALGEALAEGAVQGKPLQVWMTRSLGRIPARRIVLAGMGKRADVGPERIRTAVEAAVRAAVKDRAGSVRVAVADLAAGPVGYREAARAAVIGAVLGGYRFTRYSKEAEAGAPASLGVVEVDRAREAELTAAVREGQILGEAVSLARDWVNLSANDKPPARLAELMAQAARDAGVEAQVLAEAELERLGAGGILAVGGGSTHPPRLLVLRYGPQPAAVALVGKGVTFDTGGISLKPADSMGDMKSDMAGAAAAVAAMVAIARLGLPASVLAVVPLAENMPSGSSYRPSDVLRMLDGHTVEVVNTDAEGRLLLADAVAYARREGARRIVDLATLTGACVVALGEIRAGLLGNDPAWVREVEAAAARAGERVWAMPTDPEYREQLRSEVADLKNTGGRPAGMITGGLFIGAFAGETPWAHLDVAGVTFREKSGPSGPAGGTGYGVLTLVALVEGMARDR